MSHPRPDSNSVRNKEIEVNLFVGHSRHNYVSHIGKMPCEYPVHFYNLHATIGLVQKTSKQKNIDSMT